MNRILRKFPKSTAFDATVTQTLCIGLINFFNSGVGGGGYLVTSSSSSNKDEKPLTIDFREMAPGNTTSDMFLKDPVLLPKVGALAVAIPGELMGLWELFQRRGSGEVTWSELLEPIIEVAEEGWVVGDVLASTLEMYEPLFLRMGKDDWSFLLNDAKDGVLQEGDIMRRPEMAKLLRELSNNGSVAPFYDKDHWIVKSMVKKIQDYGGIVTEDDFSNYKVKVDEPLSLIIREGDPYFPDDGLTVLTSSGSSSGAALLSALRILDHFPISEGGDYQDDTTFQLIESMKWMGSGRSRLGDYFYNDSNAALPENIRHIMNDSWIENAVNLMRENQGHTLPNYTYYEPEYEMNEPHGTAHFSIVDKFGNAVSLTTTVNLLFGSMLHDPNTGVIFNNEMDDFSQPHQSNNFDLNPSKYNFLAPGKRPLSSAAPIIILDSLGRPDLIVGASGGSRITTAILQTIVRIYWYKMPILESIAYPRVHHQLLPDHLEVENITMIGKETIKSLENMGYTIIEQFPKSVINAIKNYRLEWHAVSDFWRKRGVSCVD